MSTLLRSIKPSGTVGQPEANWLSLTKLFKNEYQRAGGTDWAEIGLSGGDSRGPSTPKILTASLTASDFDGGAPEVAQF